MVGLATPAVLALVLANAASATGPNPIVHRVIAGGPDACGSIFGLHPGCDGNFTLVAIERADGTVTGQYIDRFANGDGMEAVIDCLVVDGNRAWVSGTITRGQYTTLDANGDEIVVDITGFPVATRVQDNGTSADDPADQISFSWFELEFLGEVFPFPGPCTDMDELDLFDAPDGQVIVE